MINASWAAGFFDGEGSISILLLKRKTKPNTSEVRVVIQVSQQQPVPLQLFLDAFGGSLHSYANGGLDKERRYYRWQLLGREKIRNFLTTLLPFLIVKKTQAEKALSCIDLQHPLGSPPYSVEEKAQFLTLRNEMMALNAIS